MIYFFAISTGLASLAASYLVRGFAAVLVSPNGITNESIAAMGVEGGLFIIFFLCAILFAVGVVTDRETK